MTDDKMWETGNRAAWRRILRTALSELGIDDPEAGKARWVIEREHAVAALRSLCSEFGDNDWPNDLHLGDIINKHLGDHLLAP